MAAVAFPRIPLPRVLCRGWRSSTGVHIRCVMPIIQAGEPGGKVIEGGLCSLCYAHQQRAYRVRSVREARRTRRLAATGKLPAFQGDPFAGFYE